MANLGQHCSRNDVGTDYHVATILIWVSSLSIAITASLRNYRQLGSSAKAASGPTGRRILTSAGYVVPVAC